MAYGRSGRHKTTWKGFTIEGTNRKAKIVQLCKPYHSRDARDTLLELMWKDPEVRKEYPTGLRKVEK